MTETQEMKAQVEQVDRERLAAAWGDHPQWADVRASILDGSCQVMSDTFNLSLSIALHALANTRAPTFSQDRGEVERAMEECRLVAIHHSNYGHIEGNRRAFVIADDIERRIAALRPLPEGSNQ